MKIGAIEKGKLGELCAFRRLIEGGAMPFLPIADIRGVDAVVRKKDGTYVEIQVKATWPPQQAGYFNVTNLIPRNNLFIVCLIMGRETPEAWILPSVIFVNHATMRKVGNKTVYLLSLGLGETRLEQSRREKLTQYRENWSLLTGDTDS
ncbi:MAG: hypothetical protein KAW00_06405 [Dehalococcoidia bacterium]|nr:hypothetical protein [Dehalococcoidia bacterium]